MIEQTITQINMLDFDQAVDVALERVRAELLRQTTIHETACTHPANSNHDNLIISLEETLEVALDVTRAMQTKPFDQAHLEEEIIQAAATYVGWIVARLRKPQIPD